MKKNFVNHLFTKIIEGRNEPTLSISAIKATIEHVESVAETIRLQDGEEVVQNVLGYKEVNRALNQLLDYCNNSSSVVSDEDHTIYYDFLHTRLLKAQSIIDSDMQDYGF
jgi:hypothetical protein